MDTFTKLYNWVIQSSLTIEEKFVYSYIIRFTEGGVGAFEKPSELAKSLGIEERTCKAAVRTLLDAGLITRGTAMFRDREVKVLLADMDYVWDASAKKVDEAVGRNTGEFIGKFLKPYDGAIPAEDKKLFRKRYIREKQGYNKVAVEKHIVEMPYNDFLKTVYWHCVSREVKRLAGRTCAVCGKKGGKLHTHHKTYENHGAELDNLGDLICVCRDCHRKLHNK